MGLVFVLVFIAILLFVLFEQALAATIFLCGACLVFGWSFAHITIATECERLGTFYVDKNVYKCVKIEVIKDKAE